MPETNAERADACIAFIEDMFGPLDAW